jgi:hypothetical protein
MIKILRGVLPVLILLLPGCTSDRNDQPPPAMRVMNYSEADRQETKTPAQSADKSTGEIQPRTRMVIKTAELFLAVDKFEEAFAQAQKIASQNGGFIVASSVTTREENRKSGSITLRVPSTKFDETLDALKKLASSVENESVRGNDVTEEFYDVAARLENKQNAEKRYQEILKSAKTVKDILEVEQALTTVREEIEHLTGRKRFLADQVELSTINATMHEPYPLVASGRDSFWSKVVRGFQRGVDGFADVVSISITFVIALLPVIVVVMFMLLIGLKYYRRYRARPGAVESKESKKTQTRSDT